MSTKLLNSSALSFSKGPKQPPPPTRVSDNLRSEDQIEVLLGLGEGPWSRLHDGMKSFYIANTPLMASDGTLNFPEAQLFFHKGTQFPDPVKLLLGGSASGHSVGVNLSQNTPVTRTTTTGDIDAIDVRLRIDQLMKTTDEGDKLNQDLLFKIEVKPTSSSSGWTSLPPNTGWLIDNEQPVPDDSVKKGFAVITQFIENIKIEQQLTQYQAEVLAWEEYKNNVDGPIDESLGIGAYVDNIRIYGVTSSPVMKEIRIPVARLPGDTYDIRVTKISAESDNNNIRELTWDTFEQITIEDKVYPNTVMMQGIFKASDQLANVPQMYGIYDTTEVLVPTIFDPLTLSYDFSNGPWDGSFKTAFTSDLAWIIYDLVHNDVHGIAAYHPINFSKYEALEASLYWNACDPVTGQYVGVPRPNGGTRPRVSFNGLIDSPRNSMELLTYMAGAGNAVFYEDVEGNFRLKVEQDTVATKTFNNMDVIGGKFDYSLTDINARYNDITVVYRNKRLPAYQEDRRRIFSQDDIDLYGRKPLTFVAVGCVDTDEAISRAYHKLITSLTETRTVSFTTTRLGAYVEPHDIILISDEDMEEGISRRCTGYSPTRRRIFINEPFTPEVGVTDYVARFQTADGIFETPVTDSFTTNDGLFSITFESVIPEGLDENFSFSIGSATEGDVKPYRVISIEQGDDNSDEEITITAIEVNRSKYGLIDNYDGSEFDIYEEEEYLVPSNAIQDFEAVVSERQTDAGKVKDVDLTWSAPQSSKAGSIYVIKYTLDDGLEEEIYRGSYLNFTHKNIPVGKHTYTIATLQSDGTLSPETRRLRLTTGLSDYGLPQISAVDITNQKDSATTYVGSSASIKWNLEPTEAWEGWDIGKPHPDFDHFRVQFNGQGSNPPHVEQITEWSTRTLTIPKSLLDGLGTIGDIRNYSVTVYVVDSDGNQGAGFTRNITKPPYSVSGATPYHPESVSTQGRLKYVKPDDPDFVGLKVWLSDSANAHTTGTLQWEGAGEPFVAMQDGLNYIAFQTIDVFGSVGMPITEIQYNASVTPTSELVANIETDIATIQSSVQQTISDITDLETVYGDTVSAAQSAQDAANSESAAEQANLLAQQAQAQASSASSVAIAARDAAQGHSDNAADAADIAEQAEENATIAKNAAVSAQGSAESASTSAALSASNAAGSESAAATSESNAATSANDAGQSASAAASSASVATTKASEASVSASSAASQAVTATTASQEAQEAAALNPPTTFENPNPYFMSGLAGDPDTVPDVLDRYTWEAHTDVNEGQAIRNTAGNGDWFATKKVLPYIVGNTYRITVKVKETTTPTDDETRVLFARQGVDYSYLGGTGFPMTLVNGQADTLQYEVTASQIRYDQGARFIRAAVGSNMGAGEANDGQWNYYMLKFEDITSEANALGSASAAATSAQQASASETASSQSASAASASANQASTSAGQASSAEAGAATSETNAQGSANSAASSATNAASSENAAGNSATAAAGSASTAASSASAAAQSASASDSSRLAAETAEGNAQSSASAAATSETNAQGSANAAATSASNAATSENAAGNSASAAATSASVASTEASDAATSATAADNARLAAETAEGNAAVSESAAATSETNAQGSANSASSSATLAANSQAAAASSASAAATSASNAASSETAAGQSASSASSDANLAATSAGAAQASENSAASSASSAAGSASAASSSASLSATASDAAFVASLATPPGDFETSTAYVSTTVIGNPTTLPDASASPDLLVESVSAGTRLRQFNTQTEVTVAQKGAIPYVVGNTYRVSAESARIAGTGAGFLIRGRRLSADYSTDKGAHESPFIDNQSTARTLYTHEFIATQAEYDAGARWVKGEVVLNRTLGERQGLYSLKIEDLTPQLEITGAVTAAASSAAAAAASQTAAGQSALASETSNLAAATSASAANVSESNAATAASNASGSEASALSYRDQVVTLYDNESGRVTAVEASISSQASTIAANESAAASLRTDVDANTASVSTNAAAISNAEGDIASLTTSVNTANSNASIALNTAQTVDGVVSASIAIRANGASFELFDMSDPNGNASTARLSAADIILDGSVQASHIAANSITADKLNVTNLNAVSATLGEFKSATTGARMEIKDDRIIVYDASNTVRVKIGNLA